MRSDNIEELNALGISGQFFAPEITSTCPAILVLGGSDGGLGYAASVGKHLSACGYAVLALAYFKSGTLSASLTELPLEYFDVALRWLEKHPRIDAQRIGVFGFSKGAEAALLLASRNNSICAVVAVAPSHVAWEGLEGYKPAGRSSWSLNATPVCYVEYDRSVKFSSLSAMYRQSLENASNLGASRIAVDKIGGPILLLSGSKDKLWPSAYMAEQLMTKLKEQEFSHMHQHICYENAGHAIAPLFRLRDRLMFRMMSRIFGGDAKANRTAQLDAWERVVSFFGTHLSAN